MLDFLGNVQMALVTSINRKLNSYNEPEKIKPNKTTMELKLETMWLCILFCKERALCLHSTLPPHLTLDSVVLC